MRCWLSALRALARRPGFALTVIALLALGIAANTALFSVVDTVILKPLPYPNPDRLVLVLEANSAKSQSVSLIAPGRIEDWNRMSQAFTAISGQYSENVTDTGGGEPERLTGIRIAPRYFEVFSAPPILGRMPAAAEEQEGGPGVAVISYGLWTRRYGQDPGVLARHLVLGGVRYSIIGVMPKNFAAPTIDVWIPAQTSPWLLRQRDARFMTGVGRMKPGITPEQAQADLARVQQALAAQFPATDKGWSASVRDLKTYRLGDSAKPLILLFAAVALLLSITVTNVAGLVLARLDDRQREIAIRFSIGGGRAQVVAALMREIAIIALAGAVAGWAGASLLTSALAKLFAGTPRIAELQMDWRALLFAAGVSAIAALVFGLLPAIRATGRGAGTLLRAARGAAGRRRILQPALVTGQIGLTMALLAGAGLLLRSFDNLSRVDLGFNPSNTLIFHVGARWDEDRDRIGRMQETLVAELNRLPGVQAAGVTNFLPAAGATLRYQVALERAGGSEETARMPAGSRTVSPGYLKALQAKLVAGNWCPDLRLDQKAPFTAMVNRRFVDVYAHGENVVGRHLQFAAENSTPVEIVGVIGDLKEDGVDAPAYPYVYSCARAGGWPDPEYTVRASGDPRALLASVRELVRRVAPNRAIFGVRTMDEALDASLDRPRSSAELLAAFAVTAMLLAAVGLYSLLAHFVNGRRQELGLRLALGATPSQIVGLTLSGAARLVGVGIILGALLAVAGQKLIKSMLFGVAPLDPVSLTAAAAVLAAVSLAAALLPARRAAAIDPAESMRSD